MTCHREQQSVMVAASLAVGSVVAGIAVVVLLQSCGARDSGAQEFRLAGRAAPLVALLDACGSVSESELAGECLLLADKVRNCEAVSATCSVNDARCALAEQLQCVEPSVDLVHHETASWMLSGPLPSALGVGQFSVVGAEQSKSNDEVRIEATVTLRRRGSAARWLPAARDSGVFRLDGQEAFLHARYQPEGGLVLERQGEPTLADRLYGLRSELFSAAVLTGDVELVALVPEPGQLIPGLVAALGIKLQRPAIVAMESYIEELQSQWPIVRTDYDFEGSEGACLSNLKVLPGLAPCFVATDFAIVLGWNRAALETALPRGANATASQISGSRAVVDFARLSLADQRLAAQRKRSVAFHYPYRTLSLTGEQVGDDYRFVAILQPGLPRLDQ